MEEKNTAKTTDLEIIPPDNMPTEDNVVIQLKKPFIYENYNIEKVVLNFESATGDMLEWADAEYLRRNLGGANGFSPFKQNDFAYCALVASRLSGIPYDVLKRLPMRAYNRIITNVSGFLMDLG